jgi:hypothetical protein
LNLSQNHLIPQVASNQNPAAPTHIRNILNPLPLQSQPLSLRSTSMENGIAPMPLVCAEDTVSQENTENAQPFNNTSNTSSPAIPGFAPSSVIAGTVWSSAVKLKSVSEDLLLSPEQDDVRMTLPFLY